MRLSSYETPVNASLSLRNVQLRRYIRSVKKKKQEVEKNFSLSDINKSRKEIDIGVTRSIL